MLLGVFLVFDLGRANLPYIIHWDYKQKYEVGSLNPIVDFLRDKPYEHRVAGLPFRAPQGMELFDAALPHRMDAAPLSLLQHPVPRHYPNAAHAGGLEGLLTRRFAPRGTAESAPLIARQWQLTNTRYLLGPAGYLDLLNQQLDPGQHRFRIAQRFQHRAQARHHRIPPTARRTHRRSE